MNHYLGPIFILFLLIGFPLSAQEGQQAGTMDFRSYEGVVRDTDSRAPPCICNPYPGRPEHQHRNQLRGGIPPKSTGEPL